MRMSSIAEKQKCIQQKTTYFHKIRFTSKISVLSVEKKDFLNFHTHNTGLLRAAASEP